MKIAVILFTLREALAEDADATLAKVAEMGYKTVQVSGLPKDTDMADFRKKLDKHGLKGISPHIGLWQMQNEFEKCVADCQAFDSEYAVIPWIGEDSYGEGWDKCVKEVMTPIAEKFAEHGIKTAYHNHAFEFAKDRNGKIGYDVLWETADPNLIQAELDTYWVDNGGGDPAAYIEMLKGRCPMTHWKDKAAEGVEPPFEAVGSGSLDWVRIKAACEKAGTEWAIVELDRSPRDPFECIRTSREHMLSIGLTD